MQPEITESFTVEEAEPPLAALDPSSRLIIEEAEARGIEVEILAPRAEYFRLRHGGRSITCRESLSELTSAVALSRCDDKRITAGLLNAAELRTPAQRQAGVRAEDEAFMRAHGSVVVKPARGEQGRGVCVGIRTEEALARAIAQARELSPVVLLEEFAEGDDLRVIVIGDDVVAAAIRKPPVVVGDGEHTVVDLIVRESRRRAAATGGESKIPLDPETTRCVQESGYALDDVLPVGTKVTVRRAANLHTGGTIHDVTAGLHPTLREVAVRAARALEIPVMGLDLIVPDVGGAAYWIIEANERPGLANHEPQPTAARFVDFLFPDTIGVKRRA